MSSASSTQLETRGDKRALSATGAKTVRLTEEDGIEEVARTLGSAWDLGTGVWIKSHALDGLVRRLGLVSAPPGEAACVWFGPARRSAVDRVACRCLELLVVILSLCLLPLWAVCCAVVFVSDPGPMFFWAERAGIGGRPFRFVKLRTMWRCMCGAKCQCGRSSMERRQRIIGGHEPGYAACGQVGHITKDPDDARILAAARWIRSSGLDEVPQFWHVLRGEMALVGPRPYPVNEVASFQRWHHLRHRVKPGLTGLWQVNGRSSIGFDESVLLDLYYVANASIFLDIAIVLRTPVSMLFGRGGF